MTLMNPVLLHEAWRMLYNNNQTHIIHIIGLVGYPIQRLPVSLPYADIQAYCHCVFQKHASCEVQKPTSRWRSSLLSIIITITSNEPSNTETPKSDRNPP